MTTQRKIDANRKNAGLSTGPRTQEGKRRSSTNASKHRLSVPVLHDPNLARPAAAIAVAIAEGRPDVLEVAGAIAEAQLDILRIRHMRSVMINRGLGDLNAATVMGEFKSKDLVTPANEDGRQTRSTELDAGARAAPHAGVLKGITEELAKLDRYERRALSRRKSAIRRFDATRAAGLNRS